MPDDPDEVRKRRERAARLRAEIRRRGQPAPSGGAVTTPPETPREAIARRMRELDRKKES